MEIIDVEYENGVLKPLKKLKLKEKQRMRMVSLENFQELFAEMISIMETLEELINEEGMKNIEISEEEYRKKDVISIDKKEKLKTVLG